MQNSLATTIMQWQCYNWEYRCIRSFKDWNTEASTAQHSTAQYLQFTEIISLWYSLASLVICEHLGDVWFLGGRSTLHTIIIQEFILNRPLWLGRDISITFSFSIKKYFKLASVLFYIIFAQSLQVYTFENIMLHVQFITEACMRMNWKHSSMALQFPTIVI